MIFIIIVYSTNYSDRPQASGAAIPSFVGSLLDEYEQSGSLDEDDEQNIKGVAGNIYSGKYCCRSSSNTLHIIIF